MCNRRWKWLVLKWHGLKSWENGDLNLSCPWICYSVPLMGKTMPSFLYKNAETKLLFCNFFRDLCSWSMKIILQAKFYAGLPHFNNVYIIFNTLYFPFLARSLFHGAFNGKCLKLLTLNSFKPSFSVCPKSNK